MPMTEWQRLQRAKVFKVPARTINYRVVFRLRPGQEKPVVLMLPFQGDAQARLYAKSYPVEEISRGGTLVFRYTETPYQKRKARQCAA